VSAWQHSDSKCNGSNDNRSDSKGAKKARPLKAGADHVVVTDQEELPARVAAVSDGKGANLIFDPVSGPYVETLAQAAAHGAMRRCHKHGGASTGLKTAMPDDRQSSLATVHGD
jgi:NADPH:quinone reductase-like Zn-dependent oxidoreductase